jgi:hypothetical protein
MSNTETTETSEHRNANRVALELEAVVQIKDGIDENWKEVTEISTVSRNGAGFAISRDCPVGRLLSIVLPMPRDLRAYDLDEKLYPVMGIVQNCYKTKVGGKELYYVGVAFIGKSIPESFKADPTQSYRVDGMREDGMWQVVETKTQFKTRKHPRIWERLEVSLTLLRPETKTVEKETTFTQNIGAKGVSVESGLNAKVGDKIKFQCKDMDFFAMAVVRNRKLSQNKPTTLHLEFIDGIFPIEKIPPRQVPDYLSEPERFALANDPASRQVPDETYDPSQVDMSTDVHDPSAIDFSENPVDDSQTSFSSDDHEMSEIDESAENELSEETTDTSDVSESVETTDFEISRF